jgi:hypothetical protein
MVFVERFGGRFGQLRPTWRSGRRTGGRGRCPLWTAEKVGYHCGFAAINRNDRSRFFGLPKSFLSAIPPNPI